MEQKRTIRLRTRVPVYCLAVLLLFSLLIPNRAWAILVIAYAALTGISYLWVWAQLRGLHVERNLRSHWVAVGDRLDEWFTLHNGSPLPGLWFEVTDRSNVPGYRLATVRSVSPVSHTRWRERAVCERRGRYQIGPWTVTTGDPFGLFEGRLEIAEAQEIIIHPPIHTDLPLPLPSGFGTGQVRRQQRAFQATVNAAGVRDYVPDDPLHHIHWRKTAQTGSLQVRQFDRDTAGDIWILLDSERHIQLGSGKDSTEEHAVLLAASLAAQSLYQDRAVGLAAYADEPLLIPPQRGEGQRWRILRGLALLSAESNTPLTHAINDLGRNVQRGSAVLIITPSDSPDWIPNALHLSQRGIAVSVALFDRSSFGGEGNSHAVQTELARIGISTTTLQQGDVGIAPEAVA